MLSNPGKTFSREEIGKISGINQERSIDVMITRLRQKIENNPKNPKYLQTIRGLVMFSGLNRFIKIILPKTILQSSNNCCGTNNHIAINNYYSFL